MDWKFWTAISLGFGALVATCISASADKHLANSVTEMAIHAQVDDDVKDYDTACENIRKADEIADRERKEILDGIRKWKRSVNYDEQIRSAHAKTVDGMLEFKESINYDSRRQDIDDEYDEALDIFKDSIDYDYEMDLANAEIKDAEALYKKHVKRIDIASGDDDDISDALSDVKKAEKEKMNDTIKEAKSKISSLKTKVSNEETRLGRKKQAAIRDLDAELVSTRNRLQKAEQETCKLLDDEKSKVEAELRASVEAKRTEAEQNTIDAIDDNQKIINDWGHRIADRARDIYENTTESEKWAQYFKSKGVPKVIVGTVVAIPLIPAGYLLWKYVRFMWNVVKAM